MWQGISCPLILVIFQFNLCQIVFRYFLLDIHACLAAWFQDPDLLKAIDLPPIILQVFAVLLSYIILQIYFLPGDVLLEN
jgi:hypothetical protein